MTYTAFVSHASEDSEVALKIVDFLEGKGIACWVAPRDVRPGHEYAAEIVRGIADCPVMLLVLSEHANESIFVKREVERGVSQGKPVFPIRVREVLPSRSLELFISSHHWIDAWRPPLEQYLGRLVEAIQVVVRGEGDAGTMQATASAPSARPSTPAPRSRSRYWIGGFAAALLAAAAFGLLQFQSRLDRTDYAATLQRQAPSGAAVGERDEQPPELSAGPAAPAADATAADATAVDATAAPRSGDDAPQIGGAGEAPPVENPSSMPEMRDSATASDDSLTLDQVMAVLANQSGGQRYKTLESLAGSMPALTTDQLLEVVGSSAYRLKAIELLKARLPQTLPFADVMKLVRPVRGGERYKTIEAFAERMPEGLTTDQLLEIIESSAYRLNAIELLKHRLPETLAFEEAMLLIRPVKGGERYKTLDSLVGRMPANLTTDQLLAIIESSAYRLNAIELLKERLPRTLTFDDVMQIVGPVRGGERYNTIKAFIDRVPASLTTTQVLDIVASSAYRLSALELLEGRLPDPLPYDDLMQLVGPVKGGERYNTIKLLAGRVAAPLTSAQVETVIESSSYANEARNLLLARPDQT